MSKFDPQIQVEPDDLIIPEVREWSLEKYRLVGYYCDIFTAGMRHKWDQLVYIDLYAGAGYSKIIETGKVYKSSALIAMSNPVPFTKYILCEKDEAKFEALSIRVEKEFKHLNCELIFGDCNERIAQIVGAIPAYGKGNTLLPFCFVDPYSLNLRFETINVLSNGLMDFLILQALHMDANRNFYNYIKDENNKVENYLGLKNWRELFEKDGQTDGKGFVKFLSDRYQEQMFNLGYQEEKLMHPIKSNVQNLPLYYLSYFSKHRRGVEFFKKVQSRVKPQLSLEL